MCNRVFYAIQQHLHRQRVMSGFVHLLALSDQVAAVQQLMHLCLAHASEGDVRVSGGPSIDGGCPRRVRVSRQGV